MNIKTIVTNSANSLNTQNILKGVNILLKYNPDGGFYALHDTIFFGDLGREEIEVSEEDSILLKELGWTIDEEFSDGEWKHYV